MKKHTIRVDNTAKECLEKHIEPYYQPRIDMCLPVCIKVVLDSLVRQYSNTKIKMRLNKISKLCGYQNNMASAPDIAVDNLNERLIPHGFGVKNELAPRAKIDLLKDILANCCFPIVQVSTEFFNLVYKKRNYEIQEGIEYNHGIVITNVDEENGIIYFFDPLQKYMEKRLSPKEPTPNYLLIPNFMRLWNDANRWTIWIQPSKIKIEGKPTEQLKLEEVGE